MPNDPRHENDRPSRNHDLTARAVTIFQRRSPRPLSEEDGRESLRNLTGFFAELLSWKREDDAAARAAGGAR